MLNFWKHSQVCLISLSILQIISGTENGLGQTPQMGWNSWNYYGCDGLNQEVVKQAAKYIKESGMINSGYEYINLDDCWQISRNATTGEIIADPTSFPDGIPALVDYVHSLGLKFGLYSDAGTKTCAGRPGSLGYETIDAETYAQWNVDYLKYDNCNNQGIPSPERYTIMANALNSTNKQIFYSICNWGQQKTEQWAPAIGNSWRTTGDIRDNWVSFITILEQQAPLYNYAGPGGWNDPDMLEVGNGGMTTQQYQTQFAFWSLLKAPLLIGCDVTNMSSETINILNNTDVINVNQDPLGKQGFRFSKNSEDTEENGKYEIWGIPQADYSTVLILWNRNSHAVDIKISFDEIRKQFQSVDYPCYMTNIAMVRDLINRKQLDQMQGIAEIKNIDKNYISMIKLSPNINALEILQ